MEGRKSNKNLCILLLAGVSCLLCGCGKTDLLSNMDESQANDVISILQQANLAATKRPGIEATWTVTIKDADRFSQAVELLKSKGFPKTDFNNLGKVFQKSGLVSSPLEERARLMYAMAESISETLSKIPGVLTARVHVVLPENDPYAENNIPSSAAVFISYRAESSLEESVREIKYLVTNSIQGLSYDKVSIALFPVTFTSDVQQQERSHLTSVLGISVDQSSASKLWTLIGVMAILLISAIGVACFFGFEFAKKSKANANAQVNAPVAVQTEPAPDKTSERAKEDGDSGGDASIGSIE
ncbi:MAG: type III secretion inner membrane ring lipoprotein SctJ [Puniceicoccales bacterium]|jgi:type III secretion protein J|nr:type III secretion inner membrane ring lipoprotein SctJ [Puniceicoccales bacterium]